MHGMRLLVWINGICHYLQSIFSAQFYEVLVINTLMSSALTSITHFLNDLTPRDQHSSKFALLK